MLTADSEAAKPLLDYSYSEVRHSLFRKTATKFFKKQRFLQKVAKINSSECHKTHYSKAFFYDFERTPEKSMFHKRCPQHLAENKQNLKKETWNDKVNFQALKIATSTVSSFFLSTAIFKR